MNKQAFVFIGRAGAGKGTQAKHLRDYIKKVDTSRGLVDVETGAEFRKFIAAGDSYTSKLSKNTVETGGLMPEFMPIYLWAKMLISTYTGDEHLLLDGTPRKLLEAKVLDSLFPFYGMGKPWIIYLDIDHDESVTRLMKRAVEGRKDDNREAIERRKVEYETNVHPTVEYYRTNPNVNFLDIDGEQSIEAVHADIVKRLGL